MCCSATPAIDTKQYTLCQKKYGKTPHNHKSYGYGSILTLPCQDDETSFSYAYHPYASYRHLFRTFLKKWSEGKCLNPFRFNILIIFPWIFYMHGINQKMSLTISLHISLIKLPIFCAFFCCHYWSHQSVSLNYHNDVLNMCSIRE